MSSQFRIKNFTLLMALAAAACPVVGYAASAARIEFVSGSVVAITSNGIQRDLSRGATLESGEAVRTGDNARAQLRFSDGAMMSLQPQTEFRIDNYNYNGKVDGEEKGFFSLIKGGLRTITGFVGKGNRDNYKVSTSVATIGIRGTEYSTVFTGGTDGVLNLSTGEGAVEICNSGGCVIITGGESAVVTGVTAPTKTFVPPKPASVPLAETTKVTYSAVETTTDSGTPLILGADLVSGSNYAIAWSEDHYYMDASSAVSAIFGAGSKLESFKDGSVTYTGTNIVSAFALDGVIGWGYWSSGYNDGDGILDMADVHYVVGKPTSSADLSNLSGMVGTYALAGYTTPTSSSGSKGSSVTGSFEADFSRSSFNTTLGMNMDGRNLSASASGSFSGANFSFDNSSFAGKGIFAGTNASHAGYVYKLLDGNDAISGAVVFKQTGLKAASP